MWGTVHGIGTKVPRTARISNFIYQIVVFLNFLKFEI